MKDDLWEALSEYPDAKKLLLEKGREILKKEEHKRTDVLRCAPVRYGRIFCLDPW